MCSKADERIFDPKKGILDPARNGLNKGTERLRQGPKGSNHWTPPSCLGARRDRSLDRFGRYASVPSGPWKPAFGYEIAHPAGPLGSPNGQ